MVEVGRSLVEVLVDLREQRNMLAGHASPANAREGGNMLNGIKNGNLET
jgi:hypothetical protein